jgi:hypothetical protein
LKIILIGVPDKSGPPLKFINCPDVDTIRTFYIPTRMTLRLVQIEQRCYLKNRPCIEPKVRYELFVSVGNQYAGEKLIAFIVSISVCHIWGMDENGQV